jgi:hypothetical protein
MAGNKGVFLAAALAAALPLAVHAQTWRPIARRCAEIIDHQQAPHGCASCIGFWPLWTQCTVENDPGLKASVDPGRLQACIKKIWDHRLRAMTPAAVGDPVAEAIFCAGGQ